MNTAPPTLPKAITGGTALALTAALFVLIGHAGHRASAHEMLNPQPLPPLSDPHILQSLVCLLHLPIRL